MTGAGVWSTWSARKGTSGPCPCRRGLKTRSTAGWRLRGSRPGQSSAASTKAIVTGERLSPQGILRAVARYEAIAPHDLRRTFAKLAFQGGAKLDQIQLSLGHTSIQTTERYLGVQQDLMDAPCDYLHLKVE